MGDILQFEGMTTVDVPPEETLNSAKRWGMTKCIIIGIAEDNELCFGGSFSDVPLINLLLDRAKHYILNDDESGFTGQRTLD
jgi:hypothetical protein